MVWVVDHMAVFVMPKNDSIGSRSVCKRSTLHSSSNFVVHALGILHSVNIFLFLYNFKLVGGESESAFFFSLWSVHIAKLKLLHNESRAVHSK